MKKVTRTHKVKNQKRVKNAQGDFQFNSPSYPVTPFNMGMIPGVEQITSPETMFKNLRYFLVSNFRQFIAQSYAEIGLIQTIVDVPVDDAIRGGITIKSKQLSEEQIEQLLSDQERNADLETAGQAAKWNRLNGGAAVIVLIEDQDPEEPLDVSAIGPDTAVEFRAVDMWELFWDKQNTDTQDMTSSEHGFEHYQYYTEKIHKSRVFRMKGIAPPSFIRPRLRGWGLSEIETLIREINNYLKSNTLSFEVLDEFKLDVYKFKGLVNTLLGANGDAAARRRVAIANGEKNYQHAIVLDSDDEFDHKQLSFAGLAEMNKEFRIQVASALRFPLTKLFGISAAGFNSGEDDIEVYNGMVEGRVRSRLKPTILKMLEIRCQSLFGMVPDDLKMDFKPLRILSAEGEENVKTQKFNRVHQARTSGEISKEQYCEAINKENLLGITLDPNEIPDIEQLPGAESEEPEKGPQGSTKSSDKAPEAPEPKEPKK